MNLLKFILLLLLNSIVVDLLAQSDTLNTVDIEAEKNLKPSDTHKTLTFSKYQTNAYALESLAGLLSKTSNIFIKSYGEGNISTPSVRGTGSNHTQLYWNGVQINSPTLGQSDLSLMPLFFFSDATMHLGSSSVADGSGGIGGALKLDNDLSFDTKLNVDLRKYFGSFGRNTMSMKAQIGNKALQSSTRLYYSTANNNFKYKDLSSPLQPYVEQQNGLYTQLGLGQDVAWKINKKHELDFKSMFFDSYRQIAPTIGASLSEAYQKDFTRKIMFGWNVLNAKNYQSVKAAEVYDRLNYINTIANVHSNVESNSYSIIYNASYYLKHFKFSYVFSHQLDKAKSTGYEKVRERDKTAGFVQLEQKIGKKFLYHLAARQEYIDSLWAPISPTVGLKYSFKSQTFIAFNASKTFRAPTLNDLYWTLGGNSELKPEIGYSSEFNLSHQIKLKKNKLNISLSSFYAVVDNWIQWVPTAFGYWSPYNLKEVENKGVEAGLEFKRILKDKKWLFESHLNYSYTESSTIKSAGYNDQSIGRQLIYVPKHSFNLNAQLQYKRFKLGYFQTLTGKVFIDATNSVYLPYYSPADISLSYTSVKHLIIEYGIKLNNIYNEEYQIVANRPLPMRYVNFLVRFNFKE